MTYSKKYFSHYKEFYEKRYGTDLGNDLYNLTEQKLTQLIQDNADKNNKYIRWHFRYNMLPVIAMYLTLREYTDDQEDVLPFIDEIMQVSRLRGQKKNRRLGRSPFGYQLFRLFSKKVVQKSYPCLGWEIEWVTVDKNEVHFDMKTCIYYETTKKYRCPELCQLFCANDDVSLAGFQPAIVFKRENTIARGGEKCDFHFCRKGR